MANNNVTITGNSFPYGGGQHPFPNCQSPIDGQDSADSSSIETKTSEHAWVRQAVTAKPIKTAGVTISITEQQKCSTCGCVKRVMSGASIETIHYSRSEISFGHEPPLCIDWNDHSDSID